MFVRVVATPGARKERITKASETEFAIQVREPAERNMANKRICVLLAQEFHVPLTQVRLLTGHRSRVKLVSVDV